MASVRATRILASSEEYPLRRGHPQRSSAATAPTTESDDDAVALGNRDGELVCAPYRIDLFAKLVNANVAPRRCALKRRAFFRADSPARNALAMTMLVLNARSEPESGASRGGTSITRLSLFISPKTRRTPLRQATPSSRLTSCVRVLAAGSVRRVPLDREFRVTSLSCSNAQLASWHDVDAAPSFAERDKRQSQCDPR
jgi:hypothetical protein